MPAGRGKVRRWGRNVVSHAGVKEKGGGLLRGAGTEAAPQGGLGDCGVGGPSYKKKKKKDLSKRFGRKESIPHQGGPKQRHEKSGCWEERI